MKSKSSDKIVRLPASQNIWYALATIAGDPFDFEGEERISIQQQNAYYWNGYMRQIIGEDASAKLVKKIKALKKQGELYGYHTPYDFMPELSQEDINQVRKSLKQRKHSVKKLSDSCISFERTEFEHINFYRFVFPIEVNFTEAKFKSIAFLNETYFEAGLIFTEVVSEFSTIFDSAIFGQAGLFQKTNFGEMADFSGATFMFRSMFNSVEASMISFDNATFIHSPPVFYQANIKGAFSFIQCTFPSARMLKHRTSFFDPSTPMPRKGVANNQVGIYENLGLLMKQMEKHHDQHMFFRQEMRMRRILHSNPIYIIGNFLYWMISNYGYGIGRASAWWVGNIVLGSALLYIPRKGYEFTPFNWKNWETAFSLWYESLPLGVANAFSFLGLSRGPLKEVVDNFPKEQLAIPYGFSGSLQTILGAIFLFFLLLTARNRYRMS